MSNSRKPKGTKEELGYYVSKGNIMPLISNYVNNAMYNFEDIIPDTKNPIKALDNILKHNSYVDKALQIKAEGIVGKGFNITQGEGLVVTDPAIIKAIPGKELRKLERDYQRYGRSWKELNIYNNSIVSIWHTPAITWSIGCKKYANKYVQYYGVKEKEKSYDIFDEDAFKLGRHPNGTFIQLVKNGQVAYGEPTWISAEIKMQISKEIDRTCLAHFVNDAKPDLFFMFYGATSESEESKKFIKGLNKLHQGSDKKGKDLYIFNPATFKNNGKGFEVFEPKQQVITADNLALAEKTDRDNVSVTGVPHWMVGLERVGNLGSGTQTDTQKDFFIENELEPGQRRYYEEWDVLFPNMDVQLNTISKSEKDTAQDDITMQKGVRETTTDLFSELMRKVENADNNIKYMENRYENY